VQLSRLALELWNSESQLPLFSYSSFIFSFFRFFFLTQSLSHLALARCHLGYFPFSVSHSLSCLSDSLTLFSVSLFLTFSVSLTLSSVLPRYSRDLIYCHCQPDATLVVICPAFLGSGRLVLLRPTHLHADLGNVRGSRWPGWNMLDRCINTSNQLPTTGVGGVACIRS